MTDMAIVARAVGGPEVLEWIAQDTPAPGPGEARIAQRAIGVNFIDTYYRSGSLLGAAAIGTVGSAAKLSIAQAHGYAYVIDTSRGEFVPQVRELAKQGCDVVYDSVGKDTWQGSLKSLRPRGMFVSFGQSSGPITDFKLADLAAGGSLYASRPTLFDYIKSHAELQTRARDSFARLAAGEIQAHVGQRMPLREAVEAHRALASRRTVGATVLLALS